MSRHYCFTAWTEPDTNDCIYRYMIYGVEICPETKKKHYQGYMELYKPMRLKGVKTAFGDNTMHLEKRQGTRDQARAYCMKDGNFREFGTWIKGQGHRTDLEKVANKLVNGDVTITEVMEENPVLYCKYRNGLKDLGGLGMQRKTREFRKLEVEILSGPTGCGKTRRAFETAPDAYKIEGDNLTWWDGYNGEETIIIDEYNNNESVTKMLNLLDGYQLRLATKGSFTYANWTRVIITTNLTRDELHPNAKPAHRDALFRRVTDFVDMWPSDALTVTK